MAQHKVLVVEVGAAEALLARQRVHRAQRPEGADDPIPLVIGQLVQRPAHARLGERLDGELRASVDRRRRQIIDGGGVDALGVVIGAGRRLGAVVVVVGGGGGIVVVVVADGAALCAALTLVVRVVDAWDHWATHGVTHRQRLHADAQVGLRGVLGAEEHLGRFRHGRAVGGE